jgi:pilus assembly protein CpaF
MNIVVSGGTGSGKTTLLNVLGNTLIPQDDRVLIIENRKELQIKTLDTKYYQTKEDATRPGGPEDIGMKFLVSWMLRKFPTRIIVGEIRGPEAYDALTAWNSGHDGSMCTIHANNAMSAVDKLTQLALSAGQGSEQVVNKLIRGAVDLIVQIKRDKRTGQRRISEVMEIMHPYKFDHFDKTTNDYVKLLHKEQRFILMGDTWLLPIYQTDKSGQLVKRNNPVEISK